MAADVAVSVKDQATSANIPVDGVVVPVAGANPTAGQAIRQGMAIGDGSGLSQFANVDTNGYLTISLADLTAALKVALIPLVRPPYVEAQTNRARMTVEALAAGLTLATLTTVGTVNAVTTQSQIAGNDAGKVLTYAQSQQIWSGTVRARIT